MKGYIISVIGISIIGSVISMLSPDGEGGGISKHIRLVYGLCVVIVCINPINEMINYINELDIVSILEPTESESDRYEEIFDGAYEAAEVDNLKNGIKQILNDRFGIDGSECKVSVTLNENREFSRVIITLFGSAVWKNTNEIEAYLGNILRCEIISVIG